MNPEVVVRNRQRGRRVDVPRLRGIVEALLVGERGLASGTLGVQLISARAMAAMNWRWLRHEGSTDILTFDHRSSPGEALHGELFISVDDAVKQAREFGATASLELVRYVVHGVLHLLGYDDLEPAARRVMKREEERLVRRLERRFPLAGLVGGALRRRQR